MNKVIALLVVIGLVLTCAIAFAADAKKGEELYGKLNCKMCHSIKGVPAGKKSDLAAGPKLTEADLTKWVRTPKAMNPKTTMPAYDAAKISDADLADLVAYMLTLK
jgi:mono/diheme cytochrome c family protein